MSSQNDYQSNGRYDNIYSQIDSEAKMSFSVDVLANIAIELQRGIGHQDRFQRLITTLRQVLECDASALLRYDSRQFIPLAIDGLAKDVLGRRFALEGHPRLEAIARAGDVVRFPADSKYFQIAGTGYTKMRPFLSDFLCCSRFKFKFQNL